MVKCHRGPATVNGDETRICHYPLVGWEDSGSRMIRKPGDLPEDSARFFER